MQREVGGYRDGQEGDWDGLALLMVSYDNAGSIESSNTRDDILRLIKKFEVPTISIDLLHQMIVEFREKRENHAE